MRLLVRKNKAPKATKATSAPHPLFQLRLRDLVLLAIPLLGIQIVYFHQNASTTTISANQIASSLVQSGQLPLLMDAPDDTSNQIPSNRSTVQEILSSRLHQQRPPDGTFQGYPVYYQQLQEDQSLESTIHCIGETNAPTWRWTRKREDVDMTWAGRSCHFQLFCLDLDTKQFAIYPPSNQTRQYHESYPPHMETHQTMYHTQSTQNHPYAVSIGGINAKWTFEGFPRLKWFPEIRNTPPKSFYALPEHVAMIPFHSLASFNPGHMVWDDFLPIYTLLQIFQLDDLDLLLLRYQIPGERGLWAGCDWRPDRSKECEFMLKKFGPLLVRNKAAIPFNTVNTSKLLPTSGQHSQEVPPLKSNLVCAKQGLAGLGALTDHGYSKGHGWERSDYQSVYNHGRGGQLWRFRNFMMNNLGIATSHQPPGPKFRLIFSERSSRMSHRSLDFTKQMNALKASGILNAGDVSIESHVMKGYTIREQAEMVGQGAMYVTGCGGGAVTTIFLPRGSSVIVYYAHNGGIENNKASGSPARLDWDYLNNMAYSRVHWLPQLRKDTANDLETFVQLVQHEVSLFRQQWADYLAYGTFNETRQ